MNKRFVCFALIVLFLLPVVLANSDTNSFNVNLDHTTPTLIFAYTPSPQTLNIGAKKTSTLRVKKAISIQESCMGVVEFTDPIISSSLIKFMIHHLYNTLNQYSLPKKIIGTAKPLIFSKRSLVPDSSHIVKQTSVKDVVKVTKNVLQSGDLVQVLSWEEISRTLDNSGKFNGLYFMPSMKKYCGEQFKILRVVKTIKLDNGMQRKMRAPTVFLDGAYCDGIDAGCDRMCFNFWREEWLQKITPRSFSC